MSSLVPYPLNIFGIVVIPLDVSLYTYIPLTHLRCLARPIDCKNCELIVIQMKQVCWLGS